jgi:hypothetical protein
MAIQNHDNRQKTRAEKNSSLNETISDNDKRQLELKQSEALQTQVNKVIFE